ncbi:hypothetical protein CBS101457_003773 [Exobasidium rhododendri]|nr:hypothetical protein CBS101457_003773 [Exobasidium rhododendri]
MADATEGLASLPPSQMIGVFASFMDIWNHDPRAVWSSFSMIVVSEIGDKTFLIAAILAMRQPQPIVYLGAFGALAIMSVLSTLLGVMFPTLLPKWLTTLMAALLFFVFGIKMFKDGLAMTGDEMGEEWEEAKREVEEEEDAYDVGVGDRMELRNLEEGGAEQTSDDRRNTEVNGNSNGSYPAIIPYPPKSSETPTRSTSPTTMLSQFSASNIKEGARNLMSLCFSPIFAQAFVLTFLGEWGDRSQIATIALAAAHNIYLVSFGTIAGHALCTAMAVLGGSYIAKRISIKHVTLGGATLFVLFGIIYLYESIFGGEIDMSPLSDDVAPLQRN